MAELPSEFAELVKIALQQNFSQKDAFVWATQQQQIAREERCAARAEREAERERLKRKEELEKKEKEREYGRTKLEYEAKEAEKAHERELELFQVRLKFIEKTGGGPFWQRKPSE